MIKAIFYKEWIKTKWIIFLSAAFLFGFSTYLIMNLFRVIELKGAVHIWEVMIQKDALFIDSISIVPLILGILFAITQFVPEMQRKCLKLTLHLPYDARKMIFSMVGYGGVVLLIMFALTLLYFYLSLSTVLACELVNHNIITAVVWFLAVIL